MQKLLNTWRRDVYLQFCMPFLTTWRKGSQAQNHNWQGKGLASQGPVPQHPNKASRAGLEEIARCRVQIFKE